MQLPEFRNEPFTDFTRPENQAAFQQALDTVRKEILGRTWPCWIGGEEVRGKTTFDSFDPGELTQLIGKYQKLAASDAEVAVEKAHAAFPAWAATDADYRVRIFLDAAQKLRERKHLFSAMLTLEVGKSWAEADADTAEAIDFLEYYAGQMLLMAQPQPVTPVPGERNQMIYIPLGVGVVISPWNFPLAIMAGMTSAALLAGNTVVLKPASQSPAIAAMWVDLMYECGLPKQVLNFITGPGSSVGGAAVQHALTRFISFTGSRDVGLWIFEQSAKIQKGQIWMKRLIAEMGGKDSILVDSDCDLEKAVDAVVASAFGYQGQKCSACSRAIVHEAVYDRFVSMLPERVAAIRVGHPSDRSVNFGPMVDGAAKRKTMEYIESGKKESRLLIGGDEGPKTGHYVKPTVFVDVPPKAVISQEEIFGPVLAVIKVKDFEQGLEVANNTEYGLTGSVFTNDPRHKEAARQRFHVGNFYINRKCTGALVGGHPFGGFNMSGTDSKAGGPDYLLQFLQAKTISEKL
ncbi:MAG: L-glutamate gamma-semialdehyde dehydrogenase [Planctomycetes bacterium]|nr:L-glutamate gamma-semialdehyde dehydrogenase [Planctomycetota bacterium]MCC7395738.1 L-glutamate gamma-semialdehyde dehydrogenase [Planctomycetota bacterium]